jgi:hypothetical protein
MRSNIAAMPWPPPMHMVTSAYLPWMRCSSYSALTVISAPVAPIGWPSEMPEPLGLTLAGSAPALRHRAGLRGKGLVGLDHVHLIQLQARARQHRLVAGTGPMPMILGSTPAWA